MVPVRGRKVPRDLLDAQEDIPDAERACVTACARLARGTGTEDACLEAGRGLWKARRRLRRAREDVQVFLSGG